MLYKAQYKGLTLLEFILVLAIVILLVIIALRQYERYQYAKEVKSLQVSVELAKQAMNQYFFLNCANLPAGEINYQSVIDLLPMNAQKQVLNPWSNPNTAPFSFYIHFITADQVQLILETAPLKYPANDAAHVLDATPLGNRLQWRWQPSYAALLRNLDSNLWITQYQQLSYAREINKHKPGVLCQKYF